ncbi:MAG: 1-(5-phosphoribosyl)-5-[(5-phosphoribosylamino)methylideneamino]imidazole-4-carboxamide isomerase [Eggerthellaceae bacterium]|nr:1-(5-phosphoribosyl)-5-[(5-phosphoribosylamino)methylideneamino]imidazole-4-carboxamide isomerase [Eggerthellaceae bacterium]
MLIIPAIDMIKGQVVRLFMGDYAKMTVYSERPEEVAQDFVAQGVEWIHLVDLEGAKNGEMTNLQKAVQIKKTSGLKVELGGGIRSMEAVDKCISAGIDRLILGTAAVMDRDFLVAVHEKYGDKIAVGVDIRDGFISIKGWTEESDLELEDFCDDMVELEVFNLIVTDISKDGAMKGANTGLYEKLRHLLPSLKITASGGVSSLKDVKALAKMNLYAAIVGKAYYTGDIKLKDAIDVAKC